MSDTAARLLALLSLLQSRPDWTGTELAARLGVSTRTIRNDIDRISTFSLRAWSARSQSITRARSPASAPRWAASKAMP